MAENKIQTKNTQKFSYSNIFVNNFFTLFLNFTNGLEILKCFRLTSLTLNYVNNPVKPIYTCEEYIILSVAKNERL